MPCGVGDYTAGLAAALSDDPHVQVGVLTDVRAAPSGNSRIEVLPLADGWRLRDALRLWRGISTWKPDLVHVQYPTQGYGRRVLPWLIPSAMALRRTIVVQTWHEYYRSLRGSLRNIPNAIIGGGLVAVRPRYIESLAPIYRWLVRRKRFRYIPNASSLPIAIVSDDERSSLRTTWHPNRRIIAYFGFALPAKGIEQVFEIADPGRDFVLLICKLDAAKEYDRSILSLLNSSRWAGHSAVTGFLSPAEAARTLASVDAVILPFMNGGGAWNTSIQAAMSQGTFVLTTSTSQSGYSVDENVYYARPRDTAEMSEALTRYSGTHSESSVQSQIERWAVVRDLHLQLYTELLRAR